MKRLSADMCGIFGYIGESEGAAEIILSGLKILEYRGYDSWGIAIKNGKKISIEKHVGKIGDAKTSLGKSTAGIGHTRWATHGGISYKNAHPHLDCNGRIAVIHNGIIENFEEIKEELSKKGHLFLSETDTEVFSHLLEENLKNDNFENSFRKAFKKIKGLNAILALNSDNFEIAAAKTGSPLVIGKEGKNFFISSDYSGIAKHTKNILFLKDGEMAIINSDIKLFSFSKGKKITPLFKKTNWRVKEEDLSGFPHFMLKEIFEQKDVIKNLSENHDQKIEKLASRIEKAKGTFLIGSGTAFNACIAGAYLFSKIAKEHVNTQVASEFNYLEDFLNRKSLIIALSQSGETIDVIEPLIRAKEKGSKIVGVTNSEGSTIDRLSDYKFNLDVGTEKAVASTKAYLAKLVILISLSFYLSKKKKEAKKVLKLAHEEVSRLLSPQKVSEIEKISETLLISKNIYIIGRGVSYPSALEAALKIKEVSYIPTEGFAGGELKHGTIALIEKGTPCIVFAPKDETYESTISNAIEIKSRGGLIIGIGPKNSKVFDSFIEVKDCREASLIPQIVPAQLIAYFLAVKKGLDPDKPRNLAKSVTVK